jgi:hypothetical protein
VVTRYQQTLFTVALREYRLAVAYDDMNVMSYLDLQFLGALSSRFSSGGEEIAVVARR